MYKVGDTVEIKDIELGYTSGNVSEMKQYVGEIGKITIIVDDKCRLTADGEDWIWNISEIKKVESFDLKEAINLFIDDKDLTVKRVSDGLEITINKYNEFVWDSGYDKFKIDDEFIIVDDSLNFTDILKETEMLKLVHEDLEEVGTLDEIMYEVSKCYGILNFLGIIHNGKWYVL